MMISPFSIKDNLMIADFILDKSENTSRNTRLAGKCGSCGVPLFIILHHYCPKRFPEGEKCE
jgi:hypothetical protein